MPWFEVGGARRFAPEYLWRNMQGALPLAGFVSDGCTCSPDSIWGMVLWPACVIHDYAYRVALPAQRRCWHSRWLADRTLRRNISRLVRLQNMDRVTAWLLAWVVWGRVRIWGGRCYQHWADGEEPLSRWLLFREAWGLWRMKQ